MREKEYKHVRTKASINVDSNIKYERMGLERFQSPRHPQLLGCPSGIRRFIPSAGIGSNGSIFIIKVCISLKDQSQISTAPGSKHNLKVP